MVNVNEEYVKDKFYSLGGKTQENNLKDIKEDEEILKEQEKKENRKYSILSLNFLIVIQL